MENDKRNIGRDPHIAPGVYYIQKELCARIDGDRIIVEKKESEDERIRKWLIKTVHLIGVDKDICADRETMDKAIAWLEKQKEPHYTKRNALFDMCVENCDPKTVEEVNKRVDDIMNMPELSAFEQALTNFIGDWEDDEERWPSKFMKKHGKHILDMAREELQKEQKPPITGNDFGWIDELKHDLEHPEELDQKVDDVLKQRKGIRALEWSEEDNIGWDEAFACVTRAEKAAKNEEELQNAATAEKWLKEIKFKYYGHPVKQEWSEEDELNIGWLIAYLKGESAGEYYDEMMRESLADWLKSLRPQPRWKPSKKQMTNLINVRNYVAHGSRYWVEVLNPLIEDLKKLM